MIKKTFTCTVLTPMFIGKINPEESEMNADAIKGAIRFWYRATQTCDDIHQIKEHENKIFGSTNIAPKVYIRVQEILPSTTDFNASEENLTIKDYSRGNPMNVNLYTYMNYPNAIMKREGFGFIHQDYYKIGSQFSIELSAYGNDYNVFDSYDIALKYLAAFGGLGNRNRNANGQFCINEIPLTWSCIQSLYTNLKNGNLKKFTAFSSEAQLLYLDNIDTVENAYAALSRAYRTARHGNKDCAGNYINEGIDKRHDIAHRRFIASPANTKEPLRAAISKAIANRHAKSLFMNICKHGETYIIYILYLPYEFMKDNDEFKMKDGNFIGPSGSINKTDRSDYIANHDELIASYKLSYGKLIEKLVDNGFTNLNSTP